MKRVTYLIIAIALIAFTSCTDEETIPSVESNPELTTDLIGNITEVYVNDIAGDWTLVSEFTADDNMYVTSTTDANVGQVLSITATDTDLVSTSLGLEQSTTSSFLGSSYTFRTIKANDPFLNRAMLEAANAPNTNVLNNRSFNDESLLQVTSAIWLKDGKLNITTANSDGTYTGMIFERNQ